MHWGPRIIIAFINVNLALDQSQYFVGVTTANSIQVTNETSEEKEIENAATRSKNKQLNYHSNHTHKKLVRTFCATALPYSSITK